MAASGLHISISAEKLFTVQGLDVTNSMVTSIIASVLLIAFGIWVKNSLKSTNRPTGIQNLAEWIIESLSSLVHSVTGNKKRTAQFFPLIATFFLFILANNWLGLLPGIGTIGFRESLQHAELLPSKLTFQQPSLKVHASEVIEERVVQEGAGSAIPEGPASQAKETTGREVFVPYFRAGTADLNMTLALGLISVVATQIFGFSQFKFGYFQKYLNFSSPISFFVGILEFVSELSKIISFAFRLFGNIFAGEVLLAVVSSLVGIIAPMPFYGLEIFVGVIQALVFSMLSLVLFNMAMSGHGDH